MSVKPNVNPTAKARFQDSAQNVSSHREMIESNAFQRACDFAMLEYQQKVATHTENTQMGALAGFFRILGAQEFLAELRRLAESAPPLETRADNGNLIHTLK